MKKAREMVSKLLKNKDKEEFDEDEKKVEKHLVHDIQESKKSIEEDKKLRRYLKKED